MSRKRVCWDGPDPKPGDYLAGRKAGQFWRIAAVEPVARRAPGDEARLVLKLDAIIADALPRGVVIHPWTRVVPTVAEGPPRARQIAAAGAVGAVMKTSWRDPTDTTPNASRQPRRVTGWRGYCPLRRMQQQPGTQIEERHVLAADHLRLLADAAEIGHTNVAALEQRPDGYGPVDGPSGAALKQANSAREVARVLRQFTAEHQDMLVFVVLRNNSLSAWCGAQAKRTGQAPNNQVEMGRLLVLLDLLAKYYESEIEDALARDRMMGVA